MSKRTWAVVRLAVLGLCTWAVSACAATIKTVRIPEGGIQPQVVIDAQGTAHLIYFKGSADAGDLFYANTKDGGATFSKGVRVNSSAGSAIAMGTIRGAHIAVGKENRIHIAWMGSKNAEPKGPGGAPPMLYTRMKDDGSGFEQERNVMQYAKGLDGGGTVAADKEGRVYVVWHATGDKQGEENRRVYMAVSSDEGKTFARESAAFNQATGACSCCGMAAYAAKDGKLYLQFRSATQRVNRDMFLLVSKNQGAAFTGGMLQPWKMNQCVMSTASFSEGSSGVLAAWETKEQVYFTSIDPASGRPGQPVGAPGMGDKRKHPAIAGNSAGETVLVWTEGTGWNKGGRLAWQFYGKDGRPSGEKGSADGVPTWSFGAAFATDEGFTIIY